MQRSQFHGNRLVFSVLLFCGFGAGCAQKAKLVDGENLKLAALAGDSSAQLLFGDRFANGDGVAKDLKEALRWYRLAAEQGNTKAQTNLGLIYSLGTFIEDPKLPPPPPTTTSFRPVAQDFKEALIWYRLAAEQGYAPAQSNLAEMYSCGQGVPQNDKESLKWYRAAAEQGEVKAQRTLGKMYYEGLRVRQDYLEALRWYRLAAEQGEVSVQYDLGVMYEKGQGVRRDYEQAHMWFNLAAANGHPQAAIRKESLRPLMTLAQIDVPRLWRIIGNLHPRTSNKRDRCHELAELVVESPPMSTIYGA